MEITRKDLNIITKTLNENNKKSYSFIEGLHLGFKGGIELNKAKRWYK